MAAPPGDSCRRRTLKRLDAIEENLEEATRRCESRRVVRRVASIGPGPSAAGTLRVFVHSKKISRSGSWWWELFVEGRLIDDGTDDESCLVSRLASRGSFGTFVDRVEVITDRKLKTALLWTPPPGVCDGLVVRRPANPQKTHVRVSVFRKSFPTRYKMSSSLKKVAAGYRDDMTRDAVLTALSRYADRHNLRNPDDLREIFCDDLMKNCFGVDSFSFSQLGEMITPHLQEPDPLIIDYTIPPAGDQPSSSRVKADVLVDVNLKQSFAAQEDAGGSGTLVGDLQQESPAAKDPAGTVVIKGPSLELIALSRLNAEHSKPEHFFDTSYAKLYSTLTTTNALPSSPKTTTVAAGGAVS